MPTRGKGTRKPPILTYRQRQVACLVAKANRTAINNDVDLVLAHVDAEARRLSKKHKRAEAWFHHQFYQGGRVVRQKRAPGICNAARQLEGFLAGKKGAITEEEREKLEEIKAKIKELNGVENASQLPSEMKELLLAKAKAWRAEKDSGVKASTRAVVQDARCTLQRISDELMALTARTEMQTFLFAVKGRPEHTMPGFTAASEKAGRYLLHGMKKHSSDIMKEFEAFVLGNVEGMILNHNGRLAELKRKIRTEIREGLAYITGDAKATMQYERYEKSIVVEKGVQIINWPEDVPFINASDIGSVHMLHRLLTALTNDDPEERCRWVQLSEQEWEARQKAYYDAAAQKEAPTRKGKRKRSPSVSESSDEDESDDNADDNPSEDKAPRKRSKKKARVPAKENDPAATGSAKKAGRKGTVQAKGKAPTKSKKGSKKAASKKKNAVLGPAGTNA